MEIQNEILYHTIHFFLKKDKNRSFLKLSKLIYLFDLKHIESIGVSATGKNYYSWSIGPMIKELFYSVNGSGSQLKDFSKYFDVSSSKTLTAKFDLDFDVFSPHQLSILEGIENEFKNDESIENIIHQKNDPWHIFYEILGEKNKKIPMNLIFENKDQKEMLQARFEGK